MNQQQKSMNKAVRCYYGYSHKENQIPSKWTEFENFVGAVGSTFFFFVESKKEENNRQVVESEIARLRDIMNKNGFWAKVFDGERNHYAKMASRGYYASFPKYNKCRIILHMYMSFLYS